MGRARQNPPQVRNFRRRHNKAGSCNRTPLSKIMCKKKLNPPLSGVEAIVRVNCLGAVTMYKKPKTENPELGKPGMLRQIVPLSRKGVTTLRRSPEELAGIRRVPAH
jgi:hypothetical protein